MDWVHCNQCFRIPGVKEKSTFYLTSCGHVVCRKCSQLDEIMSIQPQACPVCNNDAKCIEINRNLEPKIQMFFRNPQELAAEYATNIKAVLDFQEKHRSRFIILQQEKYAKAVKYAKECHASAKKTEKKYIQEQEELLDENEKQKSTIQEMQEKVEQQAREIERLKKQGTKRYRHPSLNGNTPILSLSFTDIPHSTPADRVTQVCTHDKFTTPLQDLFGLMNDPVVSSDNGHTTPVLLGINEYMSNSMVSSDIGDTTAVMLGITKRPKPTVFGKNSSFNPLFN